MKKNLIKIALFGVFAFLFSAGFVSCKDYDDDIDGIKKDIESLKTQLAAISGSLVESVIYEEGSGKLTVTQKGGDVKVYELSKDIVTYDLTCKVDTDGTVRITLIGSNGTEKEVSFRVTEGGGVVNEFNPTDLTIKNGIVYYGDEPTGVTLPDTGAYVTLLWEEDEDGNKVVYGYEIKDGDAIGRFYVSDSLPLKSVVFKVQTYLNGIEAMQSNSAAYRQWTGNWAPAEKAADRGIGEYWYAPVATDTTTIPKTVVAQYHLNPKTASKDQIKGITVISEDFLFLGTRTADSKPIVKGYSVEKGILTVEFDMDLMKIKNMDADKVTTLAIDLAVEFEGAQTTVTSDYAAVYRNVKQAFKLALNDKTEVGHNGTPTKRHLYGADATTQAAIDPTTSPIASIYADPNGDLSGYAQVAIDSPHDYTVVHDKEFNLLNKIETHHREKLDGSKYNLSNEMILEDISEYGMSYRFYASDYYLGTNLTNQSDFFTVGEKTGIVKPRVFNDPSGTIAAVDRQPLVRVELYDDINEQVVNTGWVKFLIVKDEQGTEAEIDFYDYVARCENMVFISTVEHMNVAIYNRLKLTHTEFREIYTLTTDPNNSSIAALQTGDYGIVKLIPNDDREETDLLQWTISPKDMDKALDADGNMTATVTFTAPGRNDVTVTLKAEVYEPTATMTEKVKEYWNDPAYTTMYVNVEVPGSMTNLDDFFTNINGTFTIPTQLGESESMPAFTMNPASVVTEYPYGYQWKWNGRPSGMDNNLGYYFQFKNGYVGTEKDANGKEYKISVDNSYVGKPTNARNNAYPTAPNNSYSYLLATVGNETQVVATIDNYTGIIEYNNGERTLTGWGAAALGATSIPQVPVGYEGTVSISNFADNSFAKALLNRDHATGSNMFSAPIETILHNTCRDIKVTDGEFNATFYRPINVTAQKTDGFVDSENSGSRINYVDLVKLTDWRLYAGNTRYWAGDNHFYTVDLTGDANKNGKNWISYWQYYNVTGFRLVKEEITSTMNNGSLGVSPIPVSYIELTDNAKTLTKTDLAAQKFNEVDYGYILYTNNGSPIQGDFKLRLPIIVTYQWGEFKTYIDVDVVQ